MDLLIIGLAALLASGLTFFSGFGLGTILMPVFALFVPVPLAVAATAVVHFANNLYRADRGRSRMRVHRLLRWQASVVQGHMARRPTPGRRRHAADRDWIDVGADLSRDQFRARFPDIEAGLPAIFRLRDGGPRPHAERLPSVPAWAWRTSWR
jgi:hypothetical protein